MTTDGYVRCYKKSYKKKMENPINMEKEKLRKKKNRKKQWYINAQNRWVKTKIKTDVSYRIKINLSSKLYHLLKDKNVSKTENTLTLIGCSIIELKNHLESKFKDGMNWKNYGKNGWEVDHIIPCKAFNLTKLEEQRKCFHYTNLQPLWQTENASKGDKLPNGERARYIN